MDQAERFEAMSTGMILDRTFRLYAQNFLILLGIAALAYLPQLFLSVFLIVSAVAFNEIAALIGILVTMVGLLAWWLFMIPLATGAATYVVSQAFLGEQPDFRKALSTALSRVGTLFLCSLVVGIIIGLGTLFFVVPGIIFWLAYSLIVPVIMLENQDWVEARHRSWDLTSGHRGKIFVVLILIVVLQLVVQFGTLGFTSVVLGSESTLGELIGTLINWLLELACMPLQVVAVILIYYDLRIRKESFDLELLSGAIHQPVAQGSLGLA